MTDYDDAGLIHLDAVEGEDVMLARFTMSPGDEFDGWTFTLGLDVDLRLVSFSVEPNDLVRDGRSRRPAAVDGKYPEVTARDLRSIPFSWMYNTATQIARGLGGTIPGWLFTGDARATIDDRQLSAIAAEYVRLLVTERHASRALAERLDVDTARVRQLLHRAREHGLLTKGPPGKQGGDLTDRARALLAAG